MFMSFPVILFYLTLMFGFGAVSGMMICAMAPFPTNTGNKNGASLFQLYQRQVDSWMRHCFPVSIVVSEIERGDRIMEEAAELCQTIPGWAEARGHALMAQVFAKPVGEPYDELGGLMVCIAAYANVFDLDLGKASSDALSKNWERTPQIRAKNLAKLKGDALLSGYNKA